MNNTLDNAIENYYKLKKKYEQQISKEKQKILDNESLSLKQKQQKWQQKQLTCVNCKKQGGTVFWSENSYLHAMCGSEKPCKLKIKINRGMYVNVHKINNILKGDENILKTQFIESKLNLLFNYTNEEDTIKDYEYNSKYLAEYQAKLLLVQKQYSSIFKKSDNVELEKLQQNLKLQKENLLKLNKD